MKRGVTRLVIFLTILANSLASTKTVTAQSIQGIDVPLQKLNNDQVIDLRGLYSSQNLDIQIPSVWTISDKSWLALNLTSSEVLDQINSSLTISLNGLQVTSFHFDAITDGVQIIELPARFFKQGTNTLTFSGALYLPTDTETNCKGWDDPSRWMVIGPQSSVHLTFQKRTVQADLSNFPETFLQPLESYLPAEEKQMVFVLPDSLTQDDLNAFSAISYFLGHNGSEEFPWKPTVLKESELNSQPPINSNIVFVNTFPQQFKNEISATKDTVSIFPSPWNAEKNILIVFDHDRKDGLNPGLVFGDSARKTLLTGNVAYLGPVKQATPPVIKNNFSFEELGYLDRTIRGIGTGSLIYRIYIPYNTTATSAGLALQLSHNAGLDTKTSTLSIYLNGFTVASILPTAQSTSSDLIQVDLPSNRFHPGINFLRFTFDLHLPYATCEKYTQAVWATIFNQTTLNINYLASNTRASLKNYPMPFNDYPGATLVIPNEENNLFFERLSKLAFSIGASSYYANNPPQVMTADTFLTSKPDQTNYIFIGSPFNNPAINNINDLLPQPFAKDKQQLEEGYGVYIPSAEENASIGLLETIPSPWNKDGTILVLSGTDEQGISWAWDVLLDSSVRDKFDGNLMIVGSEKRTASIADNAQKPTPSFQQTPVVIRIPIIGYFLQKYGGSKLLSIIGVLTAGILILITAKIVPFAMKYEIRKKESHQADTEETE